MSAALFSLCVLVCFGEGLSQTPIETGTRYVTGALQSTKPVEKGTYVASLCDAFKGKDVVVSVVLQRNPDWNPTFGVINFTVTTAPVAGNLEASVLCQNWPDANANPAPNCTVRNWVATSDLYVNTVASDVGDISFTVIVEFVKAASDSHLEKINPPKSMNLKSYIDAGLVYLDQVVHIDKPFHVVYGQTVILAITFCPNPQTTKNYRIDSTIFGIGPNAAFAQYVCKIMPCNDHQDAIASNPFQLPLNSLSVSTTTADLTTLYIAVVGWGGDYDPSVGTYVGSFVYGASLAVQSPHKEKEFRFIPY
ncbi:uncharacterized protein LOC106155211 [Lingula anatina]|uniref:Uncharacterized protein LOC106155211 n=1 Tax=Lingula anatina TaxID=7574 RepID=A0A1S3HIV0_LINAN|nr:uncharacterized protein LOC106155211 [Lingula anatina]|eukprot:XP_013385381.1 uncharacterized protein LOC106155211 [Lingula anatina]